MTSVKVFFGVLAHGVGREGGAGWGFYLCEKNFTMDAAAIALASVHRRHNEWKHTSFEESAVYIVG